MKIPVLTIDGPSGAGKGTVSRAIAQQLGWHYLDSGSIYRALAYEVLRQNVELNDIAAMVEIANTMLLQFDCGDNPVVRLNGVVISSELATETTAHAASTIAVYPQLRLALLQKQQDFKQAPGLVADGRDMGTVVFPEADYKVYLTATAEERAKRRYKQLIKKGIDANLNQITHEIQERDRRDRERTVSPLVMAANALYLDSSTLPIDAVVEMVLKLIR
jgi:cytidylate kinase